MKVELRTEPKRILIIKPSAIGDVVHALPVLNLVRKRWPAAEISWLVTPACAGLLEGHPQLDEVILFERRRFGRGWRDPGAAAGLIAFAWRLRQRKFDLVIDLQGLFRSGWFAWASGAPVRVGFGNAREGAPLFYSDRVAVGLVEQHAVDRYLKVAAALGCGEGPAEFVFATDAADRQRVRAMVPAEPYAVLLPGTNWETKRWPVEQFAALANIFRERRGLKVVVAGGPGEEALATGVGADVNLAGKTTLRELVGVIEGAAIVVANDSGPMHIAAALGRPLVTIFGPTNPVRTGPYRREESVMRVEIPCSPCYSRKCSHTSCMKWVTAEMVSEATDVSLLSDQSRP